MWTYSEFCLLSHINMCIYLYTVTNKLTSKTTHKQTRKTTHKQALLHIIHTYIHIFMIPSSSVLFLHLNIIIPHHIFTQSTHTKSIFIPIYRYLFLSIIHTNTHTTLYISSRIYMWHIIHTCIIYIYDT